MKRGLSCGVHFRRPAFFIKACHSSILFFGRRLDHPRPEKIISYYIRLYKYYIFLGNITIFMSQLLVSASHETTLVVRRLQIRMRRSCSSADVLDNCTKKTLRQRENKKKPMENVI